MAKKKYKVYVKGKRGKRKVATVRASNERAAKKKVVVTKSKGYSKLRKENAHFGSNKHPFFGAFS